MAIISLYHAAPGHQVAIAEMDGAAGSRGRRSGSRRSHSIYVYDDRGDSWD